MAFGTGDFFGYSVLIDASKNVLKRSSFALDKLLVGGELIFENGAQDPIVHNPTIDEFFFTTFYQVSSTILWPKISYYPFGKILNGFNIQVGPTLGYTYFSTEERSSVTVVGGEGTRYTNLSYQNGVRYGYRVSAGLEFNVSKKVLTGVRFDWSNNNEGEINTLLGLKVGLNL